MVKGESLPAKKTFVETKNKNTSLEIKKKKTPVETQIKNVNSASVSMPKTKTIKPDMAMKVRELWDLVKLRLDVDELIKSNNNSVNVRQLVLKLKELKERTKKGPLAPINVKELRQMVAALQEKKKKNEKNLKETKQTKEIKRKPKKVPKKIQKVTLKELFSPKVLIKSSSELIDTKLAKKTVKKLKIKSKIVPITIEEKLSGVKFYEVVTPKTGKSIKMKQKMITRKLCNPD